jgi:hypothetical protein
MIDLPTPYLCIRCADEVERHELDERSSPDFSNYNDDARCEIAQGKKCGFKFSKKTELNESIT